MGTYDTTVTALRKQAGKEFSDMSDNDFTTLMDKQTKETLLVVREYLISSRDFYKRIMLEEYKKTHPNSFRYKDSEEQINKLNSKGKLLKVIIDKK